MGIHTLDVACGRSTHVVIQFFVHRKPLHSQEIPVLSGAIAPEEVILIDHNGEGYKTFLSVRANSLGTTLLRL